MCMGAKFWYRTFLIHGYFLNMGTFLLAELYGTLSPQWLS